MLSPWCLVTMAPLGDVDAMEVVGTEGAVALGTLALARVIARLQTFVAEHVEALGEHRLLVPGVAAWAAQLGLQQGGRQIGERQRKLRYTPVKHLGQGWCLACQTPTAQKLLNVS